MRNEMVNLIAAIGRTLVRPGPIQQMLQQFAEVMVEHLDVALARVWTLDPTADALELQATAGNASPPNDSHARIAVGEQEIGRIASEMRPHITNSVVNDPRVGSRAWVLSEGLAGFGGYPLIVDRRLVGVFAVHLRHPLTEEMQTALVAIADQVALALDHRRSLAELEAARREVVKADKAKVQFLASMSHEIRTPLNAIIGVTTLLSDSQINKEQRQYTDIIRISGDALLGLINDMLDFSKMESGEIALENEVFDLHACIEETLDLLAPQATKKRLELSYSIDHKTPRRIYGDATRLRQVLMNLLANAIKFTRVGDVHVAVTTRSREQGLVEIKFAIRDTGIGIARERLERMFNPFGQTDASAARKYGGTHLGLAICKRLCEVMNATIDVQSELEKGSTFTVTLVARAALTEPQPHLRPAQPHLSGRRVLLVDDNATSRSILREQLVSWGMVPIEAASSADAVLRVKEEVPFDVALIDTNMPEVNGTDLMTAIARTLVEDAPSLPVVLLSPLLDHGPIKVRQGVTSVVTKPIKPSQLYNSVLEALSVMPPKTVSPKALAPMVAPIADRLPLRILLAEDYVINQQVALLMLERLGYRCDVAANGSEALVALRRGHHDVVLMDVQMPEMDGFEATRVIWQEWEPEQRPFIIAMTANAMPGDRERCLAAGMDHYVPKPVRVDELRAALELAGSRLAGRRNLAPPQHLEVFDPGPIEQLRKLGELGNDGIANEIVQSFCLDTPGRIALLRSALDTQDSRQAELIAHSLKSGAGTVGARQLATLFAAIEDKLDAGDLEAAVALSQDLDRTFADARDALERAMRADENTSE